MLLNATDLSQIGWQEAELRAFLGRMGISMGVHQGYPVFFVLARSFMRLMINGSLPHTVDSMIAEVMPNHYRRDGAAWPCCTDLNFSVSRRTTRRRAAMSSPYISDGGVWHF